MIKKWYAFHCDNCGELITYRDEKTIKKAIEKQKVAFTRAIVFLNKKCFCNEDCYVEYMKNEDRFCDI